MDAAAEAETVAQEPGGGRQHEQGKDEVARWTLEVDQASNALRERLEEEGRPPQAERDGVGAVSARLPGRRAHLGGNERRILLLHGADEKSLPRFGLGHAPTAMRRRLAHAVDRRG